MAYEVQDASLVNHYSPKTLSDFSVAFMRGLGATADEAAIISDGLMTASQWWHPGQGQGLEKLFRYTRRVKNGGIRPDAPMTWLVDAPAYALLDAAKGFGYVAAQRAMTRAIDKARTAGIAMVGVRHSNHFGIAGYHALTAAKQGLIGWACTNAAAMTGPLLPIGEYKGYGLSLFTDVLAGVMTGALFGLDVFQDDTNFDVGHMMIAIDPAALMTAADFDRRLEELVGQVKGAEPD